VSSIVARPYAGATDLRRIQDATSARFGRGAFHVGDIAWAMRDQGHVQLLPLVTLLESSGGELLGYSWLRLYGWFDAVPLVDADGELAAALLAAAMASIARCVAAGDRVENLGTLCDDEDEALAAALANDGFVVQPDHFEVTRRSLDDLPMPVLPAGAGLRVSSVEDDALVDARVEAHRAAFGRSRLTVAGFMRLRHTWPYRAELDRVVVDQDGRVLAACLAWIDEACGWGLLEPVGTRPEHRRRGLAAAVCLDALHALRAAGAHSAQVSCESGSPGCATYHAIGFRTERRMRVLRRPLA
jgi:predicted N-acetyltransferase YhbS